MRYCKRCLYPANHPLGITFDAQGVCSGCRIHEEKDELDWEQRGERLGELFDRFRDRSGKRHDCIVPVSGARDSYYIVHVVKNVYGMRPLLVSYNKQYNTKRGIRNLAYLRTQFDCDYLQQTLSPEVAKRVTRHTLERMGSMYWHCLAGETAFPVRVAVRFKIPLIVWGVHQGCDQVGMYSHLDEVEMSRRYRKDHDLMGCEARDLVSDGVVDEGEVRPLMYPDDKQIEVVGVRGIYLSNFTRWDSKAQHEQMIDRYGYETAPQQRTFDTYNDVDSHHYSGVHDYIKFLKHGYGKVTDHASREIRLKRMTREEGIDMVERYRDVFPSDLPMFLDWLDMSEDRFFELVNRHRSPEIWDRGGDGEWQLKDSILEHRDDPGVDEVRLPKTEECEFVVTPSRDPDAEEDEEVLMARGFVD